MRCKAKTLKGVPCSRIAGPSGFCCKHDPVAIESKRRGSEAATAKRKPLDSVLDVLTNTAQRRGWGWQIASIDEAEFKHASLVVYRNTSQGFSHEEVAGICEVAFNAGAFRLTLEKTSFYGYGLAELREAFREALATLPWLNMRQKEAPSATPSSPDRILDSLLRRFHLIARQLQQRRQNRSTLLIADEYDVQDLMHALLRGLFDDVRPEEGTPSHAGGNSRIDFILKKERIAVETKLATARLRDKLLGEELIVDIRRYQSHPDCRWLICFVYDPENHVKNPRGLERDLSAKHGNLTVTVIVAPQ